MVDWLETDVNAVFLSDVARFSESANDLPVLDFPGDVLLLFSGEYDEVRATETLRHFAVLRNDVQVGGLKSGFGEPRGPTDPAAARDARAPKPRALLRGQHVLFLFRRNSPITKRLHTLGRDRLHALAPRHIARIQDLDVYGNLVEGRRFIGRRLPGIRSAGERGEKGGCAEHGPPAGQEIGWIAHGIHPPDSVRVSRQRRLVNPFSFLGIKEVLPV